MRKISKVFVQFNPTAVRNCSSVLKEFRVIEVSLRIQYGMRWQPWAQGNLEADFYPMPRRPLREDLSQVKVSCSKPRRVLGQKQVRAHSGQRK